MPRRYDHIDLRVPSLAAVTQFYEQLLTALGFTRDARVEGWLQYEAADGDITESFTHIPNENQAEVDRIAEVATLAGAQNIEGPMPYEPGYYAAFFEAPCGNRLEVCHRSAV